MLGEDEGYCKEVFGSDIITGRERIDRKEGQVEMFLWLHVEGNWIKSSKHVYCLSFYLS